MKYKLPIVLLVLSPLAIAQPQSGETQPPPGQAQPPSGQMQPPSFEQFKSGMTPILEESLPAMKKTRDCVSKADSKEAVEKCMKIMVEMAQSMRKKMGAPEGKVPTSRIPDDFEWNPETQQSMLKEMDLSIQQSSVMQECLGKSKSGEEMKNCMRSMAPPPTK